MTNFFVRDTWTHGFVLLSSPSDEKTPTMQEMAELSAAGLGTKRVVFPNKRGDFEHLKTTLESAYPKLKSQNGAFEMMRADRGGSSRPLVAIPMKHTGYTIPNLRDSISANAAIYVRPIQGRLDMQVDTDYACSDIVKTTCVSCKQEVPLLHIREHTLHCPSKETEEPCCDKDDDDDDVLAVSCFSPPSSTTIVSTPSTSHATCSLNKDKDEWIKQLQTVFPDKSIELVEETVLSSQTMEDAAESLCEEKGQSTQSSCTNLSEILCSLQKPVDIDEYTITVDREELWRSALGFYKKAMMDKSKLMKSLCVIFKGEDGLDAGAVKVEFLEMLLKEVKMRLFEGSDTAKIPVRDSSKSYLLKLAGIAVSHSIIQHGPAFGVLAPALYYYIAGADPDLVCAHLKKEDIPLTAG